MHSLSFKQILTGLSFGSTSGVVTTLGLMVGLFSGTGSRLAVLGGILTISVADALSDAFGIHLSEESDTSLSKREVWTASFFTFLSKLLVGLTFVLPVVFLSLETAVLVSVVWGLLLLGVLSFSLARRSGESVWRVVLEHWFIGALVIGATYALGLWISRTFG